MILYNLYAFICKTSNTNENANRAKIEIIRLTQSEEIGCKWSAADNETDNPI